MLRATLVLLPALLGGDVPPAPAAAAFATITEQDVTASIKVLADPALEGRDTPSTGLHRAADWLEAQYKAAGLKGAGKDGSFRLPFEVTTRTPDAAHCTLNLLGADAHEYKLGTDFEPIPHTGGSVTGDVVFLGFGIEDEKEHYDDVRGELHGRVALIVDGEPRTKRLFEGPEISPASSISNKLNALAEHKVAGVLVVQRPPPGATEAPPLSFRYSYAQWNDAGQPDSFKSPGLPALEITPAVAQALVGQDVLALAAKADSTGDPPRRIDTGRNVSLSCAILDEQKVSVDNIVAAVSGTDEKLSHQYVVLGAHYDHIGVDVRGRIGTGADDDGSGTAALVELAQAFAAAPPRRSILICSFAGEEKGLLGSQAFCKNPPVPRESLVAMLNIDMVGRGKPTELAMLGLDENPTLEALLDRALKLQPTKIKTVTRHKGQELNQRADHYSFQQIGVPALFLFEGLPIDANKDYHTWRDTADLVDDAKITNATRLAFNCVWLLANDDKPPPSPSKPSH